MPSIENRWHYLVSVKNGTTSPTPTPTAGKMRKLTASPCGRKSSTQAVSTERSLYDSYPQEENRRSAALCKLTEEGQTCTGYGVAFRNSLADLYSLTAQPPTHLGIVVGGHCHQATRSLIYGN